MKTKNMLYYIKIVNITKKKAALWNEAVGLLKTSETMRKYVTFRLMNTYIYVELWTLIYVKLA